MEFAGHVLEDIGKIQDPAGRAVFAVTAEALLGLHKGLEEFATEKPSGIPKATRMEISANRASKLK